MRQHCRRPSGRDERVVSEDGREQEDERREEEGADEELIDRVGRRVEALAEDVSALAWVGQDDGVRREQREDTRTRAAPRKTSKRPPSSRAIERYVTVAPT